MRDYIRQLISNIRAANEIAENDAITIARVALECYYRPTALNAIHRLTLPTHLCDVPLTDPEARAVIAELQHALSRNDYPLSAKVSIVQILGLGVDLGSFEVILRFFREHGKDLDDEQAYMALIGLTPSFFPREQYAQVIRLLEDYRIGTILADLLTRKTARLVELSRRTICSINRVKGEAGEW